jgi:2-keto-4-pentenoate hydratase/2-oxohepta-3-ene-1,7-dioic acid hydratase in catechol pathway
VIDRRCGDAPVDAVDEVVRGYTTSNDLDALDQPGRTAREAFDASAPLGPWIETVVDPSAIELWTDGGGERRQEASATQMPFEPREVVSVLSTRYTFRPGDVISFGSPASPGLVEPGEEVVTRHEGVGTLRNRIVDPDGNGNGNGNENENGNGNGNENENESG